MATKKTATPTDEKFQNQDFDLFKAIEAIDRKDYGYFSKLTEEQQKKFVPYMMLHWISSVKGNSTLSSYYVMSTDINANKLMFDEKVQHHPELQWLMLCASSPGIGKQFHQYIPHLSAKIGTLRDKAKVKEISDYFEKVYKGADKSTITECAVEFTTQQNHKHRIAALYPTLPLVDIEMLASILSSDELDEYDRDAGN